MPFRAVRDRAQDRTGLQWVMADKRTRPRIIKILEKSKMPPKNVIGSAWTFSERKKKKAAKVAIFQLQPLGLSSDEALRTSSCYDLGGFCQKGRVTWARLIWTDGASSAWANVSMVSPNLYQPRHRFCFAEEWSGSFRVPRLKWQGWDSNPGLPTTDADLNSPLRFPGIYFVVGVR